MFYMFSQNNSGGSFDYDAANGLGRFVVIEADSPEQADLRLLAVGGYFNGVERGTDCPCCGARWYSASELGSSQGTDVPCIYGEPIDLESDTPHDRLFYREGQFTVFVHYASGLVVGVK